MITPSPVQSKALKAVLAWWLDPSGGREFYLAGSAGTGKTSLAEFAVQEINDTRATPLRVKRACYTGKAADVLRRKSKQPTQTLHQLLYTAQDLPDGTRIYKLDPFSALLDTDLLILDECSMVPDDIVADIRRFGVRTLVLGDPCQLPPIQGMSPFTARDPDFFLDEIHRQAKDNPIIRLSMLVRNGESLPFGQFGEGIYHLPRTMQAQDHVLDPGMQVICGTHRRRWRTTAFIRADRGRTGLWPDVDEPVIVGKNIRRLGLFNGSQAKACRIGQVQPNWAEIDIALDDRVVPLVCRAEPFLEHQSRSPSGHSTGSKHLAWLDFGYAVSCHKAQGSSWPGVTVLNESSVFRHDAARWLYTAITRAETKLVVIT